LINDVQSVQDVRDYTVMLGTDSWRLSGVNAVALNLAKGLMARGIKARLLLTHDPITKPAYTMPLPVDVPVDELPEVKWRGWPTRWRFLREHLERLAPCIYLPNADPSFSCASPTLPDSVKVIGILHGNDEFHYEHLRRMGTAWNAVVCVSQEIARKARAMCPGFAPEKIVSIASGVPATPEPSAGCRGSNHRLRIIYVGRIVQAQKRVLDIPAILSELEKRGVDFSLTMVGSGPDEKLLRELISERGLASRVTFAGVKSPEDSSRILAEHDCLLLTSEEEGMPMAILEAMSAGCVSVVSRVPSGVPELIQHGRTGFVVDIGNISGFASVLKSLADDRSLRRAVGKSAWEAVSSGPLSFDAFINNYVELFDRVIAAKGRPPFDRQRGPARPPEYLPATTTARIRFGLRKCKHRLRDALGLSKSAA
jgi:glycosyltransferase involved in cell wall biosynthesis